MTDFARRVLKINGIDTVVLSAGSGPPLVYLHGAGTVTRFHFAAPWFERFQVIVPYHPGFGESAADPAVTEIHDYVLHYLELFETLRLNKLRVVGHSMGGFIATKLGIEHAHLLERLALVCPVGIPTPGHPTTDFLKVPPQDLPALLGHDPQTVIKHLPAGVPNPSFIAEREKETVTATRVLGSTPFDVKLPRYLHRLTMPTLIAWGKADRLTPVAQQAEWSRLLPRAEVRLYDDAGHLLLDEAPAAVADIAEFMGAR
jgi:pimeloyl-ACP methyl ester carboxylesterase